MSLGSISDIEKPHYDDFDVKPSSCCEDIVSYLRKLRIFTAKENSEAARTKNKSVFPGLFRPGRAFSPEGIKSSQDFGRLLSAYLASVENEAQRPKPTSFLSFGDVAKKSQQVASFSTAASRPKIHEI